MKRKLLHSVVFGSLLMFASCSMIDSGDENTEATTDTAYVKISLGDKDSRTALPVVDDFKYFESFTFIGTVDDEVKINESFNYTYTGESIGLIDVPVVRIGREKISRAFAVVDDGSLSGIKSAYDNLSEATIGVEIGKTYEFTLTAKAGGAVWQGTASAKIKAGANTLAFTLALASLGATNTSNTGSLYVNLRVPNVVNGVDAKLFNMDGTEFDDSKIKSKLYFEYGQASYYTDLPVGNYMLKYELYGDKDKTLKLGEWREYAGIAAEVTSSSTPMIESEDDLESIYEINLKPNGGSFVAGMTATGSYTRYSDDIELAGVEKEAFVFKGWNETDSEGNALVPKTKITTVKKGSMGNVYAEAEWTESGIHENDDNVFFINLDVESELESESAW